MSSNCNRFRFLIQQQFDIDLSTQDERLLNSHLDQCESCAKFQHQLQQVIMAAEEVPLPEELLPPNPEALARTIMTQLPEQKSSPLAALFAPFMNLFGGGKDKKEKKEKKEKNDQNTSSDKVPFPHVSRGKGKPEAAQSDSGARLAYGKQKDDDHTGTNARLKKIGLDKKAQEENREKQSNTKSLGAKFGIEMPNQPLMESQDLTLADSIRLKVAQQKELEIAAAQVEPASAEAPPAANNWGGGAPSGLPANMAAPPNMASPPANMASSLQPRVGVPMPSRDNSQVVGAWSQAQPVDGWEGAAGDTAADASQGQAGIADAAGGTTSAWGGTWNEPPKGAQPEHGSEWGPPPQGGTWNEPADARADSVEAKANINQPSSAPMPVPAQNPAADWSGAAPMGAPIAPVPEAWTAPAALPQPDGMPAAGAWNNQSNSTSAIPPAQDAWSGQPPPGQPGNGWAGQAQPQAPPSEAGSWQGQAQPTPTDAAAWQGQPTASPPGVPQAAWTQPPAVTPGDSWGDTPIASPTGDWVQAPSPPAAAGWGQPPAPPGSNGSWSAAPTDGGWGQSDPNAAAAWGQSTQPQPTAPQESKKDRPAWSFEAEQVETGTWKAFTPGAETLGGTPARESWAAQKPAMPEPPAAAVPAAPAPKGQTFPASNDDPSRWDIPIQERMHLEAAQAASLSQAAQAASLSQAAQAPAAQSPPPAPAPMAIEQPPQLSPSPQTGAWGAPPAPAAPGGNWAQTGESAYAQAQSGAWADPAAASQQPVPTGNPWDVSKIQQWQQQPQGDAAVPPAAQMPSIPAPPIPPPAQTPAQQAGLFQSFDDSAIDKLFSENLGIGESGNAAAGSLAPGAPPLPAAPLPTPPPAPVQWGAPPPAPSMQPAAMPLHNPQITHVQPSPQAVPGQPMGFAPPQPALADQSPAPKITAIQPKNPTGQHSYPANPAAAAVSAPPTGLFNLDDNAIDQVFRDNLGLNEGGPLPVGAGQRPAQAPVNLTAPPIGAGSPFNNMQASPASMPENYPAPEQSFSGMPQIPSQPMPGGGNQLPPWPAPPEVPTGPNGQPNPPQQAGGGLFTFTDKVMEEIFADGSQAQGGAAASASINVNEAVRNITDARAQQQPPAAPAYPSVPAPPPKIEGVGRLDSKIEQTESTGGRIASIGKFILDNKDLETLGKLTQLDVNDTKMRILTMEAASELQTLLQHIGAQDKVVGSVIVGHDGLLIANTMPSDLDAESIGVWALGVYMNTEHVIKKMGQDRVHQIVSKTPKGYLVIADFGGGLLVTVSDGKETDTLIPLMRSITQLVAQ